MVPLTLPSSFLCPCCIARLACFPKWKHTPSTLASALLRAGSVVSCGSRARHVRFPPSGMQTSVETSPLLAHRAKEVVPQRMLEMEAAYKAKDFGSFARLAMQASCPLCCYTTTSTAPTWPPSRAARAFASAHRHCSWYLPHGSPCAGFEPVPRDAPRHSPCHPHVQDSNQFHSTCLDTYPPIFYLNDVSRAVINFVHAFNTACGKV